MADVEILTEQITHLRQLDARYGSGRLREEVVSLLHQQANGLLHGTYSDKTGKALLTAVAQATKLAGYTAADVGRPALAQRYFIQGLDLAMAAGDRPYAAAILGAMSRLATQIGQNALTEHDRLRNGRQTVALARAGLALTQGTASLAQAAELHALEARGLALFGDVRQARRAVLQPLLTSSPPLRELDERITGFLSRSNTNDGGPTHPSRFPAAAPCPPLLNLVWWQVFAIFGRNASLNEVARTGRATTPFRSSVVTG